MSRLWANCADFKNLWADCEQIVSKITKQWVSQFDRNCEHIVSTLWAHCEHIVSKLRYERNLWAHCDIPKFAINCAICEHIALICTHSAIGRNMLTICSQSAHNLITIPHLRADCEQIVSIFCNYLNQRNLLTICSQLDICEQIALFAKSLQLLTICSQCAHNVLTIWYLWAHCEQIVSKI